MEMSAMVPPDHPLAGTAFADHFVRLEDPRRVPGRCDHRLLDLVVMAVLAVVCGADGWDDVAEFADARQAWLATWLGLSTGVPCERTFRRVLGMLDPDAFSEALCAWARARFPLGAGAGVALDGKTLRGSRRGDDTPLHLVHAWATEHGLLLAQQAVAGKSNEIPALAALLDRLQLRGLVVTIDAAGCQKPIATKIVAGGGAYALVVKANQRTLYEGIALRFLEASRGAPDVEITTSVTVDAGHGRREERALWAAPAASVPETAAWDGAAAVLAVRRRRTEGGVTSEEWRYVLSSLSPTDPDRLQHVVRAHWGVENGLHWQLDVAFHEDGSPIHQRRAATNFSTLRKLALEMIKRTPRTTSIKGSRKRAAWDDAFLGAVIQHGIVRD